MDAEEKRLKTISLTKDYLDKNKKVPSRKNVNLMSGGYFSRRYGSWARFLETELGISTEMIDDLPFVIEVSCSNCAKKKSIKRCNYKRSKTKKFFCDSSCAAAYNNTVHIKRRKKIGLCVDCGAEVQHRSERCTDCYATSIRNKYNSSTLKDFIYQPGANKYNAIRYHARRVAREAGMNYCAICGYDTHVQICHIIPISNFDENDLMIDVNSPSNLLPLCPNHHWEFDNGIVSKNDVIHEFALVSG